MDPITQALGQVAEAAIDQVQNFLNDPEVQHQMHQLAHHALHEGAKIIEELINK